MSEFFRICDTLNAFSVYSLLDSRLDMYEKSIKKWYEVEAFLQLGLFINNVQHTSSSSSRGLSVCTRYLFFLIGTCSVHKDIPISFYLKYPRLVHKQKKKEEEKVKNTSEKANEKE